MASPKNRIVEDDEPTFRVVAYTRVSTDQQAEEGISLQYQKEQCEAWCKARGYVLVELITDEGASGKTLERNGVKRALKIVAGKHSVDEPKTRGKKRTTNGEGWILLVPKFDRLTRRLIDLLRIMELSQKQGWVLVSINDNVDTSTVMGRLMFNMLGMVAEWERDAISERTRTALRAKRARGGYAGGSVPIGKMVTASGMLVDNEKEMRTVARARQLHAEGMTLRGIGAQLIAEGLLPRKAKEWSASSIQAIVAEKKVRREIKVIL